MRRLVHEIGPQEVSRAHEIMAQIVMATLQNPETPNDHFELVYGNYILCCAMITEGLPWAALHDSFVGGLVNVGAEPEGVEQASQTLLEGDYLRCFLALKHVTEDQRAYGLRVGRKNSKTWEPHKFVKAILELGS